MGTLQMGIILINGCLCICNGPVRAAFWPSLRHPQGAPQGMQQGH